MPRDAAIAVISLEPGSLLAGLSIHLFRTGMTAALTAQVSQKPLYLVYSRLGCVRWDVDARASITVLDREYRGDFVW